MQTAVILPEVHLSFLKESFQAQVRTGKPNRAGGVERGHGMAAIAVGDARNFGSCGISAVNVLFCHGIAELCCEHREWQRSIEMMLSIIEDNMTMPTLLKSDQRDCDVMQEGEGCPGQDTERQGPSRIRHGKSSLKSSPPAGNMYLALLYCSM